MIRICCWLHNKVKKKVKEQEEKETGMSLCLWTYICDDGNTQVSHVGDDLAVLRGDLRMLDQFVQVFLCNSWVWD